MASLDAQNTFGFVASYVAIDYAISMASTFGVGIVGVRNSNHFGMAANYLLRAIEKGCAAMVFTNASRSMPVWGSKEPLMGTSPFAVGLPGGEKGGFVLDMSPSVVARVCRLQQLACGYDVDLLLLNNRVRSAKPLAATNPYLQAGCSIPTAATPRTPSKPSKA